jgi:type VI secretion system FHA domain protein
MTLTLSLLRCPDWVAPETRELRGGEIKIGRGAENDWVLPDPERDVSRCHCVVTYRAGAWQLTDRSTNGTFLNHDSEPVGRDAVRDLNDGDRIRLGLFGRYEIEVRIAADRSAPAPSAADPWAIDPFSSPQRDIAETPPAVRGSAPDPFGPAVVAPALDPLAPAADEAPFGGPTEPDHASPLGQAYVGPRPLLPADWWKDPPGEPAAAGPILDPPPAVPAPAAPTAQTPVPPEDLLAAFLRGAGVDAVRPADPAAAMEALGAAFRAFVSGLRQALVARFAIKREFRIENTMLKLTGNNPLKFATNDEDALLALLGVGRRSDMGAAEAVANALRDLRLHELATVSAMQAAVRGLLAEFDPARLRQAAERSGLNFVAAQKKAHAWDAFEALYGRTVEALADDFDSVFGKAFARAYERALSEIAQKDDSR